MLQKLQKIRDSKSQEGFTIIEVMIVLAIAGLILLIVFLAVPALQRNSRNTQRKNDASKLASLIGEFESNNSGSNPADIYFSGAAAVPTTGLHLDATKEAFSIIDTTLNSNITSLAAFGTQPAPTEDGFAVYTKATCSGNKPLGGTSNRQVVIWYALEGATGTGCVTAG